MPDTISIEQLYANEYVSTPRNLLVANVFKELGWIEKYGTGFGRVCEQLKADGLPPPSIAVIGDGVRVTVYNVTDSMSIRREKILLVLSKNNDLSSDILAKKTGVTKRTILRDLQSLKTERKIRRVGSEKGGHWEISE